ncbi:hypothetical protein HDV00_006716 [Rhizophlyctis rosea]|nr:hypothetical protein HDV00_006716 [Rhizophlyctis rosea]
MTLKYDLLLSEAAWRYLHCGFDNLWAWAVRKWHPKVPTAFIEEAEDPEKGEALLTAVAEPALDMVQFLIQAGADIHYNSEEALSIATAKSDMDMVEALIEVGASVYGGDGKAPYNAVKSGELEILKELLELAGSSKKKRPQLYKAMELAVEMGRLDMVRICFAHGADVNADGK